MKVSTKKQTNIIDIPEQGAVNLLGITPDGHYRYEITYRTDPRKAIQNKSILVNILASTKPIQRQPTKILVQNNPEQLIKNILQKSSISKDQGRAQTTNVFFTYVSDISAKIPNDKTVALTSKSTAQNLIPQPILKTEKLVKLKSVQEITDSNVVMPILENNISTSVVPNTVSRNTSIAKAVSVNLVRKGIDPAQISGTRLNTIQSAKKVAGGIVSQPTKTVGRYNLNDTQKVSLIGNLVNQNNPNNHLELRPTDFVNVLVDSPRTTLDITEVLEIPTGLIQVDEFFFVLQLKDNTGIEVQTITISVPHGKNVANLSIPTIPPSVMAMSVGIPGKNVLQIKQMDPNATSVAIYRKEIKKATPNVDAAYAFVGTIQAKFGDDFQRLEDRVANFNPIVYRAIPVNSRGVLSTEFTSVGAQAVKKRNAATYDKRHNFVSIYGEVVTGAISLEIRDIPSGVCQVVLLKKNLTIHDTSFTIITKPVFITNQETGAPIFITDNDVQPDRTYEYQVKLVYTTSEEVFGANNLIITYKPITANIVNTDISKPNVVQSGSEIDVQFTLNSSLVATNMDQIKSAIQDQGLLAFFQSAISSEKEKLQNIIAYGIKRTNLTTGEVEDFGITTDKNFSDQKLGPVKSVKSLQAGYEYRYAITTYLREAETTLTAATRTVQASANISYTLQPSKWHHPITLNKGNVVSDNTLKRNHASTVFSFGQVGNISTANVSLADILPSLSEATAQKFGKNSVLVQWRVQGKLTKIDHFVIVLENVGMRTVVGKSHNISDSNYFQFVDKLTDGEHGKLTYYIVPVFYDFSRGTEVPTNEVFV